MFAVIETGGKQYKVEVGKAYEIEKIEGGEGDMVEFDKVLLVADGPDVKIGEPYVSEARVQAKIVAQGRDDKKLVFRYHSKTRYRKKKGHRQSFSKVEITKI